VLITIPIVLFVRVWYPYHVRNSSKPHEVHLSKHPGYDLNDQNEFISKYGSYFLTMMYMVKYGAMTGGLFVPPLLGLHHAMEDQRNLRFIEKNIGRLVDDSISYLQGAAGSTDGDISTQQGLSAVSLTKLKSHLKIKDGECFTGGLRWIEFQQSHSWICMEHLKEHYDLTWNQLMYSIHVSCGVWNGNEISITDTSEMMSRLFYDKLSKLLRIQRMDCRRSLAHVDLNLVSQHSTSSSTTDTLRGFKGLDSLSLEFGRLKMSVKGISQGNFIVESIEIRMLGRITLDDLGFIQQCIRPLSRYHTQHKKKMDTVSPIF